MKMLITTGMIVGSFAGSYLPVLWGGSVFSVSSILWGGVGGLLGIWAGFKVASRLDV